MKFIVLGSNGMMGSMFVAFCKKENISYQALSRKEFDVLRDSICDMDACLQSKDDLIFVNCIGCIPQKIYSNEEYIEINERFPHKLAEYCKNHSYRLIHLSTDCVYSGLHQYRSESDLPDAETLYGQSKYRGEPSYGTVIRCSIIGPEKGTSCGLFAWFVNNTQSEVNGYTHHMWNGLTTLELSKFIVSSCADNTLPDGLIHLSSENALSKYTILCELKKRLCLSIEVRPFENAWKYYLLRSNRLAPRKSIEAQLDDLVAMLPDYFNN